MGGWLVSRGLPDATPALAALAFAFLNRQLRLDGAIHDVADDARAALDVALYEIQKGPSPELEPPLTKVRGHRVTAVRGCLSKTMSCRSQ